MTKKEVFKINGIEIKCSYNQLVKTEDVKENPENTKIHPYSDDLIETLQEIIKYQGLRKPIIVSELSGLIVTGHATFRVLKNLGCEEIPCDYQDFEDEKQEFEHLVADNALTYWRQIKISAVREKMKDYKNVKFDIEKLGIKGFKLEKAIDAIKDDDIRSMIVNFKKKCPNCGHEW